METSAKAAINVNEIFHEIEVATVSGSTAEHWWDDFSGKKQKTRAKRHLLVALENNDEISILFVIKGTKCKQTFHNSVDKQRFDGFFLDKCEEGIKITSPFPLNNTKACADRSLQSLGKATENSSAMLGDVQNEVFMSNPLSGQVAPLVYNHGGHRPHLKQPHCGRLGRKKADKRASPSREGLSSFFQNQMAGSTHVLADHVFANFCVLPLFFQRGRRMRANTPSGGGDSRGSSWRSSKTGEEAAARQRQKSRR
ncbi:hypothetical protein HPP92_018654 [Vanilla planifolia]|uniref:Uncharacterized protein n=1 Tax=Vanilla planifolia TaxID=51239 RepID=A0A835Q7E9_VANPL|nr:hypothetical protein HPP92_018654 [Vanilla planifolia]